MNETTASLLRFAQHLASESIAGRCDIASQNSDDGRCQGQAAGIRWENGFADAVCEKHAASASERGAFVVTPKWHDGTTEAHA